jgi:hypothetical protein
LRGAELVHARSDIPAGSALLARCPAWVWDMRGFWADERITAGLLRPRSAQERLMRAIEKGSARHAGGIVTLTSAAIDVLVQRHGPAVGTKAKVVTTCVELDRFPCTALPAEDRLRFLLAGTLSARYDVPLMLGLVERARRRRPSELVALVPQASPWDALLCEGGVKPRAASRDEMPVEVAASHVGLCVLRNDGGVSLKASMPTKIGEFLSSGRPVVVNAGLGDLDDLLSTFDCGVVLEDDGDSALEVALDELDRLLSDPAMPSRCRKLAATHFGLDVGVNELVTLYQGAATR